MSQVHLLLPSFNAGELSPLLGARFAVEKVQSGCRRLRNFLIHVHGPVFRRPGMEDMGASAGNGAKSRLVGFNFSTTTGAILEFHPNGLQVWSNGIRVELRTAVALPYSESECAELQVVQVNDVCYISHRNHTPKKLTRFADDDWRLAEIAWKWPAMGDENVRSAEIASAGTTEIASDMTGEWAEFVVTLGSVIDFSVVNPDLTSTPKTARLQAWSGTAWVTVYQLTWTTVAPAPATGLNGSGDGFPCRMTYVGPVTSGGGELLTEWDVTESRSLDTDIAQPTSARTIEIPAGEWQATVTSPATIPAGAVLNLQKLVGASWVLVKKLSLLPSQTTVYRGATLTAPLTVRFHWPGQRWMDGEATIESLEFPDVSAITLEIDVVDGEDRNLTASDPLFKAGHVGSYWQITHRRDSAFVEINAPGGATTSSAIRVSGRWDIFSYGTWTNTLFLEKQINGSWEVIRSWQGRSDRNIIATGEEDAEVSMRLRVSGASSGGRFVFEAVDSAVNGLVKIKSIGAVNADGKATTAVVDVLSPIHSTDATPIWTEGAWSGVNGYPAALALHGGRLWFAGTRSEPMRTWGSVVNDYEDFRRSSFDDAGVSFTPAAQEANAVCWMLSHESELLIGTRGDEWTLGTESGPITPTNVLMQRRSAYGSEFIPALLVNEAVIFVQRGGRKLRQVAPRSDVQAWAAVDMTVLAEHVAREGVTAMAAMSNPFSILWAVTSDGKLLGMTFEQEQNVFGWHVHETDGEVEGVAVMRGVDCDEVWLAVNRDGERRIERLDTAVFLRDFEDRDRLIYLDAAKRIESETDLEEIDGLDRLNGREVTIIANGSIELQTVIDGAVTLAVPARTIVVGLPYTSELQPMRTEIPLRDGTSQGRNFRVSRAVLQLHESLGGEVADAPDGRFEKIVYREAANEAGESPPLFSGDKEATLAARTRGSIDLIVRQRDPLPLNIVAIAVKGDVFGE